jgi:hypothetical protein
MLVSFDFGHYWLLSLDDDIRVRPTTVARAEAVSMLS